MSIVCAVKKDDEIAIAADSLTSFGALKASRRHMKNSCKLFPVNDSVMGIVGWCAIVNVLEHLIRDETKTFRFGDRMQIMSTLLSLHQTMKHDYFMNTHEDRDQPVESIQLRALVVNPNGLFEISSYREVNEYETFWAIGSGRRLGLGAMHALLEADRPAAEIVEAGVRAAAEFDDGCSLPLDSRVLALRG